VVIGSGAIQMLRDQLARDHRLSALRKGRILIAQTWESQLNLSLFLGLLVFTVLQLCNLDHSRVRRHRTDQAGNPQSRDWGGFDRSTVPDSFNRTACGLGSNDMEAGFKNKSDE
jgi:hypothetical protein